jgi:hypothetical protein
MQREIGVLPATTTQREAFRGTIPWEHSAEVTGDAIA